MPVSKCKILGEVPSTIKQEKGKILRKRVPRKLDSFKEENSRTFLLPPPPP
jgi:hypothetical protein